MDSGTRNGEKPTDRGTPVSEDDPRFVVLRHEDRQGVHFDLMIENGERLATWKFPATPESAAKSPIACRRIGEHRRDYLDYEGPISGDRGHVTRHDRGVCRVLVKAESNSEGSSRWTVAFDGQHLHGRYDLVQEGDQASEGSFVFLGV